MPDLNFDPDTPESLLADLESCYRWLGTPGHEDFAIEALLRFAITRLREEQP